MSWAQSKKESGTTEGAAGRSSVPHTQPETIRGNEEESIIQSVKKEEEDEEEKEEEEEEEDGFSAISSSSNEASGGVQKEYDRKKRSPVEPVDLEKAMSTDEKEDEEAIKQELMKETIETYKEDFLSEHSERKLLVAEVDSLRQQVVLLQSELSAARRQIAKKSIALKETTQEAEKLKEMIHTNSELLSSVEDTGKRHPTVQSVTSSAYGRAIRGWICQVCTYENAGERKECCEICGALRPKAKAKQGEGELESDRVDSPRQNRHGYVAPLSDRYIGIKRRCNLGVNYATTIQPFVVFR